MQTSIKTYFPARETKRKRERSSQPEPSEPPEPPPPDPLDTDSDPIEDSPATQPIEEEEEPMAQRPNASCRLPSAGNSSGQAQRRATPPIPRNDGPARAGTEQGARERPASPGPSGAAYARLPHDQLNKIRVKGSSPAVYRPRWPIIAAALEKQIGNVNELIGTLDELARQHRPDFSGLASFLREELSTEERRVFFAETLPAIQRAALRLPNLCPDGLRLLCTQEDGEVELSGEQAAALLACAFFCVVPPAPRLPRPGGTTDDFPTFSFAGLYRGPLHANIAAKLRCLLAYFRGALLGPPRRGGGVSVHRRALRREQVPVWEADDRPLAATRVDVRVEGAIEDDAPGALHVDFANRYLGGGALGWGCVQEEIRFMLNPECLVGMLLCAAMDDNEAILIAGAERFSNCTGYAATFAFAGPHADATPRDGRGRLRSYIVAIDAEHFTRAGAWKQYRPESLRRELDKAFAGFLPWPALDGEANGAAVATGNWGCGAFNGDREVKFALQLMAACAAGRDLLYFTFGDAALAARIRTIARLLAAEEATVASLWRLLGGFYEYQRRARDAKPAPLTFFQFVHRQLVGVEGDGPPVFPAAGGSSTEEDPDATPPREARAAPGRRRSPSPDEDEQHMIEESIAHDRYVRGVGCE